MDFFNSNGDLRGKKWDLYEGGIRSPFLAKWPGRIVPGSISDHVSSFWDYMPTFCELAGIPAPDDTDGISFVAAMTGDDQAQVKHPYLYWEFYEAGGKQAVRKGNWKGVRLDVRKGEPYFELYDLRADPSEKNNIAEQHPDIAKEMLQIMDKSHIAIPEISLWHD